jgi:hypothetical protein
MTRAAYLREVVDVLWPAGARIGRGAGGGYCVLPSAADPRLVVPARAPRAAATAVRSALEAHGRAARLRRDGVAAAFRAGVGDLVFRDRIHPVAAGLEEHLAEVTGRPVLLSVHIGPPRANRKPVVQLVTPDGVVTGFAKLGVNDLTRRLVAAEAAALHLLSTVDLGPVVVPAVRHVGRWGAHTVLVQQALPVWLPRAAAPTAAHRAAMLALARCLPTRTARHADTAHHARLAANLAVTGGPAADRLGVVLAAAGRVEVELGCWHGDWHAANSAVLADGRVLVWDWERFADDVPVGFDALHMTLQNAVTGGRPARSAAAELLDRAGELLTPFDVPVRSAVDVAMLYLVELGARYLRDRQAEAGVRLGRIDEWLLPAVEERLAARAGAPGKGV